MKIIRYNNSINSMTLHHFMVDNSAHLYPRSLHQNSLSKQCNMNRNRILCLYLHHDDMLKHVFIQMYKITNVYNFIEALSHVKRGAEYVKLDIYDTQWILGNFYVGC